MENAEMLLTSGSSPFFILHSAFLLDPLERPRYGLLPHRILLLAGAGIHLGLPGVVDLPVLAQILQVAPEAGRQSRRVGRAQRSRLRHLRTDDRHAQHVALEL